MENDTAAAATNNNTATAKVGSGGVKSNNHNLEEEHSNLNGEEHMAEQVEAEEEEDREADVGEGEPTGSALNPRQPTRTPFTNLSQVDADLALARTLQEQVSLLFVVFFFFSFYYIPSLVLYLRLETKIK